MWERQGLALCIAASQRRPRAEADQVTSAQSERRRAAESIGAPHLEGLSLHGQSERATHPVRLERKFSQEVVARGTFRAAISIPFSD